MDIPLPDDPPTSESVEESLSDIPVPEDANRYSPSLPIEDDPTEASNISMITLPSDSLSIPVQTSTVSVLGKEAAKKRLLAFSQTKFSLISQKRKASLTAVDSSFTKENEAKSILARKKKKGVLDKARDTISEIEELKRRENEVMETMQVLFPMWSNSDKKSTPVTSLIIPDGVVEKSDNVVEKILSKKIKHERRDYEKKERSEDRERRRKRERKEKEIRRLMPKSWTEFNRSRFKAYHFRRQKFKLEQLGEGAKSKERNRSHEHEREGSKKINLLDTPMVLKKPIVVSGINNEDIEFPSWAVRYTNTWPPISYCINPKYEPKRYMSRKEMFSTLPGNIYSIVKQFLSSTSLNKFEKQKVQISRSWWERDSFLIPGTYVEHENQSNFIEDIDNSVINESILDSTYDDLNNYTEENESEKLDNNSPKPMLDSPLLSSEGPASDLEKSCNSEISETEMVEDFGCKPSSPCKEDNINDGNLASEYEQFIKTIGPNTDSKEITGTIVPENDDWSKVVEESKESDSFRVVETNKNKKQEAENNKNIKEKKSSQKKKKIKKKASKRSHSTDSSSSETSSKSSSSSRSTSSSSRSSSSSSSSGTSSSASSSSSSSSSSDTSSSSSNDSSSDSSTTSTSSGSSSSSDSNTHQKKSKKLKKKQASAKKLILSKRSKSKKASKEDNEEKLEIKKNKKNEEHLVKTLEELRKSGSDEEEADDITKPHDSPHELPQEVLEGDKYERGDDNNVISGEEKKSQAKVYDSKDYSPQSRTTDEDCSNLSNTSLKSIISETVVINEQKEANNSLDWNSAEDSVSNVPVTQDTGVDNKDSPLEGKRHFNLDIFQESHNCTSDVSSPHEIQIIENDLGVRSPQNNSKQESKEENDNNNSTSITNTGEESVLKSLEKYSPTAEDEDEEEDYFANASAGGSTLDEASQSQLVSFGVNSASEEARMLDIPLPPPIETQSEAPPTSFHNILQLPVSPTNNSVQMDVKKKNLVLIGKLPVARLTFGKQVMKLKPMSIFSTEDSDSEALPEKTPLPRVSGMHDGSSLQSSNDVSNTKEGHCDMSGIKAQENAKITNEEIIEEVVLASVVGNSVTDMKPVNIGLDSPPPSKKSRWDQEALKNEDSKNNTEHMETSLVKLAGQLPLVNSMLEKYNSNEKQLSDNQTVINIPEVHTDKVKERSRKEHSRSPIANDKKKRRERSHSLERDRKRRERVGSPRYRGRFSRDRRRDFRKRSRSKDRRSRRDSPHREYSPNWKKSSPQNKSSRRSPSVEGEHKKTFEKSQRPENVLNHELSYEPPTSFDSSWNKMNINLSEIKESYNSSPKKKESLSDWESPERKYSSPPHKESPKRKKSPLHESPFRSPRNSPIKRKSPDHYRRKESPNRRYSPRRSPVDRQSWKRLSPDRRRSPYSPRRSSPSRRRVSPDRKRAGSPYRRRLSPSPERKYSRYSRKSPVKRRSYSISPNRDDKWKWDEEAGTEKNKIVDNEHFSKWDYDHSQNDQVSDYQTSLADSTISDSELVKEPAPASPKRMSLDERLKIELGHTNTNIEPEQPQSIPLYHNFYYPPPTAPERVNFYPSQPYVNPQPPPSRLPPDWNPSVHPPQLPNKLVQVGNVLQVVPTEIPIEPVFSAPPPKVLRSMEIMPPKVLQVGNMLQVVPSQEPPPPPPPPPKQNITLQFSTIVATPPSPVAAPVLKLTVPPPPPPQAVTQPVSIISLPFPPGSTSVFTKLEEKDRRKKEKELRKQRKEEKAARRMLRKAMLKKRLAEANEGENEINTDTVELIQNETSELDSSKASVTLPSPDKGILISIKDIPITTSTKKKSVSFADGIRPGEGTSPSGGEDHALSPPPLSRKPVKKRKKRKVKVRIIRIDNNAKEEESEEDELSPPPPPPGTPPPEAYIEYTASGRYLYPVPNPQPFPGNQDGATVFPAHPVVTTNPNPVVQFSTPPPQQR